MLGRLKKMTSKTIERERISQEELIEKVPAVIAEQPMAGVSKSMGDQTYKDHHPRRRFMSRRRLSERVGFEPTVQLSPYTRFPSVRLQPLGHLS